MIAILFAIIDIGFALALLLHFSEVFAVLATHGGAMFTIVFTGGQAFALWLSQNES